MKQKFCSQRIASISTRDALQTLSAGFGYLALPGFISINPPTATGGARNFGSAFLPAAYQGTKFTIADSSQRNRRSESQWNQ